MRIQNPDETFFGHLTHQNLPAVTKGRIGLRHMFTRSARYQNYRMIPQAMAQGVTPPVKAPMHDSARALQFLRSKAAPWNIDPVRIAAAGGSAGACTSL